MQTINFGKYKGNLLDSIIKSDPQYVLWCFNNIEWFQLTKSQDFLLQNALEQYSYYDTDNDRDFDCEYVDSSYLLESGFFDY